MTFILLLITLLICTPSWAQYSGLGTSSVTPETIARFAPKPLLPEMSKTIQKTLDIRAPGMGMISPNGKKLFFTWRVTGTNQVWRLDSPKSFPVQMTGGEDKTSIADITPDGKWLILSRDQNGEENPGLYIQPTAGGPLTVIQHTPKIQTFLQFVSKDSTYIYFAANDIEPDSYALYRTTYPNGKKELLFSEKGIWSISDHLDNGDMILTKDTGSLWSEHYRWNMKDKTLIPIIGKNEKEEYVVRFSAHPNEYLVQTPKLGDFRRLYRLKNGNLTPMTPDMNMDVAGFSINVPRTRIIYSVNDKGYTRSFALDARTYQPIAVPTFKDADHVFFGSTTQDGRYSTLGVETAQAPRTSYVFDWKTKKQIQWVIPSAPETDLSHYVRARLEYYPARDGTKIPMFVRRSPECEKQLCPVIVEFHGGPEGQTTPGFSAYAQLVVDTGFILVEPNVRGSDGYGKTWIQSDDGAKRLNVITDIEDCANYIRTHWKKEGKEPKIGITGGSYGGYSTLVGMTMFAGSYDAGVAEVGMSNLITFLNNTAPYRRILRITEYGDPVKDEEALKRLSPVTYLDRIKAPLLIIQGVNDPRVPAGEAIQMHESMQKKGLASDLILFADEGHGTSKRANQVLSIGHMLQFFVTHLKESR